MFGVFQNIDPPSPHRPASVYPPPLVRGEDTLAGWRGDGGSIFWKTPGTALYSTYVSTLWRQCLSVRRHCRGCGQEASPGPGELEPATCQAVQQQELAVLLHRRHTVWQKPLWNGRSRGLPLRVLEERQERPPQSDHGSPRLSGAQTETAVLSQLRQEASKGSLPALALRNAAQPTKTTPVAETTALLTGPMAASVSAAVPATPTTRGISAARAVPVALAAT
jgi:hypothetical protein